MTASVDEVIADRVKHYRQSRRWTVRQLAERCAPLIPGLTEASVTNIERARREVSAREILILAHVLRVPPVALLLPLGTGVSVELVPGVTSPIEQALSWLTAAASGGLDGHQLEDLSAWHSITHIRQSVAQIEAQVRPVLNERQARKQALIDRGVPAEDLTTEALVARFGGDVRITDALSAIEAEVGLGGTDG